MTEIGKNTDGFRETLTPEVGIIKSLTERDDSTPDGGCGMSKTFPDLTPEQLAKFQAELTTACAELCRKLGVHGSGAGFNVYREIQDAAERAHARKEIL